MPDVIIVQETWFSSPSLYNIDNYSSVHSTRHDGYGGVSIYVKNNVSFSVKSNISRDYVNAVRIKIHSVPESLNVTGFYRSQKCGVPKFLEILEEMLVDCGNESSIYCGDSTSASLPLRLNHSKTYYPLLIINSTTE